MEVILDTSFILTCLKERIDFLQAEEFGKLVLPRQVLSEIDKLRREGKRKEKELSSLALDIIQANTKKFEIIELNKKYVDSGIREYVRENSKKKLIVATLDKNLKKELRGKAGILTIRARKKLELE